MLAAGLVMPDKRAGRDEINKIICTIRRDDFLKELFLKEIKHSGDCKKICRSIVRNWVAENIFEEQIVQTNNRKFTSKIKAVGEK